MTEMVDSLVGEGAGYSLALHRVLGEDTGPESSGNEALVYMRGKEFLSLDLRSM